LDHPYPKYFYPWRCLEGIGDKTLSKLLQAKFHQVGLPFGIYTGLQEWLTTNKMFEDWGHVLPNFRDPAITYKLHDSFEVISLVSG
jgi:hypothetical protein